MLEPGLEASVEIDVSESMTARALGSGDVPVLGTPAVIALAERAACEAIEGHLQPGQTSVGTWIEVTHLAPTRIGGTVNAMARLARVDGSRLTFDVAVGDRAGIVARGSHRRVVVDVQDFLEAALRRSEEPPGST